MPHNPFATDEPSSNRWLLTTGVAGLAGAVVIGSTLLGFLGKERGGDQAPASVNPADFWQRTEVSKVTTTVKSPRPLSPPSPIAKSRSPTGPTPKSSSTRSW